MAHEFLYLARHATEEREKGRENERDRARRELFSRFNDRHIKIKIYITYIYFNFLYISHALVYQM